MSHSGSMVRNKLEHLAYMYEEWTCIPLDNGVEEM